MKAQFAYRVFFLLMILGAIPGAAVLGDDASIRVDAQKVLHPISRYMTGACIEDVNHEVYGGIYSQMLFGESFQEPAADLPVVLRGFRVHGGNWTVKKQAGNAGNTLTAVFSKAVKQIREPRLVSDRAPMTDGEVGVEIFFADAAPGSAGLIVQVADTDKNADPFTGYEVSLDPEAKMLRIVRHKQNTEPLYNVPCDVPVGQWIPLTVKVSETALTVGVGGKTAITCRTSDNSLKSGRVGLRILKRGAAFRDFWVSSSNKKESLVFEQIEQPTRGELSGMWRSVQRGSASGVFTALTESPFVGFQSQQIAFLGGEGEVGVENQGLNRWGLYFQAGKPYEGCLRVKAEKDSVVHVALESADGNQTYAETSLKASAGDCSDLIFN